MPIYEYVCHACAYRFEVKQSIKDAPLTGCIRCGKEVSKVISSPAIMFKGSGWYVTDYSDKLKPTGENGAEKKTPDKATDGTPVQPAAASTDGSSAPAPAVSKQAATQAGSTATPGGATPTPSAASS